MGEVKGKLGYKDDEVNVGGKQECGELFYVADLYSSRKLYELFNKIGQGVDYVRVCMDPVTRKSLGYGYVKYTKAQDAAKAKEMLNYTYLSGKIIRVMFSNRDPIMCASPGKLFVKNLDKSVDHKGLNHTFSGYGNILSCKIAKDFRGQSKQNCTSPGKIYIKQAKHSTPKATKFITPDCSFKNVLMGLMPITLKVTPGDEVILENIILDEDERVDPSIIKGFHEEFKDKYVCIFMLPMSPGHKKSMVLDTTRLRDVHEQIKSSGGNFNVICVPTHVEHNKNDFEYFNPYNEHLEIKFCTSFHHIHLDDSACLKRMESMIGIPKDPEAAYVILGPMNGSCRKVVSILNSDFFKWHGAEAFPFTTEKIEQLTCEDEALWSCKHDLGTLLSMPDRDYVISNDCTKVPISDLHQRTVCLLFYEDTLECRNWTEKLKDLYVARNDFEVVVVFPITFGHDHSVEFKNRRRTLKFWKVFGDMPWLAIPLDDPRCRKLWRIFSKQYSDKLKLLIIYSREQYFEENGFKVLVETGFKNYPFMRKEVVRTSVAAKREKNLSSFLERKELIRGRDLYYAGREKFTVSKLLGCSVVLLFLGVSGFRGFSDLLTGLHFNHGVTAQGVEGFEIVYIPMTESPPEIVPDCDWMLVSPKEHLIPVFHHFFDDEITKNPGKKFTMAMVSFGQFGHYNDRGIIYTNCSKEAYNLFLEIFPFNDNKDKEGFKVLYNAAINKPRKKMDD